MSVEFPGTVSGTLHSWTSPVEDLLRELHYRHRGHVEVYKRLDGRYHCAVETPVAGDSRWLRVEAWGPDCAKAIRQVHDAV